MIAGMTSLLRTPTASDVSHVSNTHVVMNDVNQRMDSLDTLPGDCLYTIQIIVMIEC